MRQLTLVALYGQKPAELSELIVESQKQITKKLASDFQAYEIPQVHATIIGLERMIGSAGLNLNLDKHRSKQERMNFDGLLTLLRAGNVLPFQVQIGGFQNRDYPFLSRGQSPYDRSFSIQGDKAVLMGWPVRGEPLANAITDKVNLVQESRIYPTVLDDIRRASQNFNILHAYHRTLTDVDNDFYFRIGLIKKKPFDPELKADLENTIKQSLSTKKAIIEVTIQSIYVASYKDETLPLKSTKVWSICDRRVTESFIESLYE